MGFNVSAGPGYQNQHLVPQALMDDDFAFKTIADAIGFNIDDSNANRLRLPTKATAAGAREMALVPDAVHQGSHPAYTRYVDTITRALAEDYGLVDELGVPTGKTLNALEAENLIKEVKRASVGWVVPRARTRVHPPLASYSPNIPSGTSPDHSGSTIPRLISR
jgi:hypothetical protein